MSNTTITINSAACPNIVTMNQMTPFQVARIVKSTTPSYIGTIVMRTASWLSFEVMSLSHFEHTVSWINQQDCKFIVVELLDAELVVNIK